MADGTEGENTLWSVKFNIKGKVQGVFYRATAMTVGERIGITGTVANKDDGTVELVAEGTLAQIEEMKTWCYRGPPMARVTAVEEVEPMTAIQKRRFKSIEKQFL